VEQVTVSETLKSNMLEYGDKVIKDLAVPALEDGLKPVQRHILLAMKDLYKAKNFRKLNKVVGDTTGNYHVSGELSVIEATVLMAQEWKNNTSLISTQGNWGSIEGDKAAGARYVECILSKEARDYFLNGLDVVERVPNYDDTLTKPRYLNPMFPVAIINGTSGIAYSMATYIPAFNIKDIANLYIEMLEGRELTTIYPDSPTHCDVFMRQGNAMSDPDFKYGMTSKVTIEDNKVTFYDIPYGVSAGTIKEQIIKLGLSYELVNKKKVMKDKASVIPIKNVFTDCDKNDLTRVDIIVLFKKGADVELAVRRLMAATDLRVSYSANMHFIYKDKPTKVDLVTMSKLFLKEKIEYKTKSIAKQLGKAKDLLSNLLGLQKCISNIKFFEDVMNNIDIQDMYDLSDSQYSYIMSMTVKRLKGVKQGVLAQQIGSIQGNISDLESQHATTEVIKDYKKILDELPSRTCKVVSDPSNVTEFDLLEDKPMLFSSYTDGTVALVVDTIKSRGRGTKLQLLNIKHLNMNRLM